MYVKVFSDLLGSSLWAMDAETCKVWITMLMMAEWDGLVRATAPGISHEARIPIEKTREAIAVFEAPDPDSRTPDNDGRRIQRVDGGYQIVNYIKYRETRDADTRRQQQAEASQRYRERHHASSCVISRHPASSHTDTDTDTDKDLIPPKKEVLVVGKQVIDAWNAMSVTCGLSKAMATPNRIKKSNARLKEELWRESYQKAIDMIPNSAFLRGENSRRWKANIEFFLRPDSVAKILEGKYDNKSIGHIRSGDDDLF